MSFFFTVPTASPPELLHFTLSPVFTERCFTGHNRLVKAILEGSDLLLHPQGVALRSGRMSEVDFRLVHGLNAVLGWLELGSNREARAELESLPAQYQNTVEVLDVWWLLHAREGDWEKALEVADRFLEIAPESAAGWLHRAYALRRTTGGGLQKAAEVLLGAVEKFPRESTIPYNLACYACQLGKLEEARGWLKEARRRQNKKQIKTLALADSDLEPLWPEIQKW